jgi:Rrf2 family protein
MHHTRLPLAIQVLTALGALNESWVSSSRLSELTQSHPVVIRRLLASLVEESLVKTQAGKDGGFALAKHPSQISLEDIFLAVSEESLLALQTHSLVKSTILIDTLKPRLTEAFERAESALRSELRDVKLSSLIHSVANELHASN